MPLQISVVTAVKNRARTLGASLRSLDAQEGVDIDHIAVDGASTDGTLEILRQRQGSHVISESDGGVYEALNKGIAAARGDVIGFLHADDELATPDALSQIARAFEDPKVGAVYGDLVYVKQDDTSQVVRYWQAGAYMRERLALGWMPPHPTFYVRRNIYERLGGFDTRYKIAADYENMVRILWAGRIQAAYVPRTLVRMRTGGLSNQVFNLVQKSREDYAVMRQYGFAAMPALLRKNMTKLPQFVARASPAH